MSVNSSFTRRVQLAKFANISTPMNLKREHEIIVIMMNPVFHLKSSDIVLKPINMNIIVSIILAAIFSTYSMVELDFFDTLNSTYCFINMPQNVMLCLLETQLITLVLFYYLELKKRTTYARILEVDVASAVRYDKYANVIIINGSNTGVFSVNLVVIEAAIANIIPIITPPKATTRKEVAPKTMSTGKMFAEPISAKPANNLYRTFF